MDCVDLSFPWSSQVDAQQLRPRPGMQAEHVMIGSGATQIDRAGMLDNWCQPPNLGKEARARLEVRDAKIDAAQAVDARTLGDRARHRSGLPVISETWP